MEDDDYQQQQFQQMQELEEARYSESLKALAECVQKGVSQQSIAHLTYECGVDHRDIENIYRKVA